MSQHGAEYQELIRNLWSESLAQADISAEDDFFERGGHSLLALVANGRLEHLLQVDIPLRVIFDHPVLSDFAAAVGRIVEEQEKDD